MNLLEAEIEEGMMNLQRLLTLTDSTESIRFAGGRIGGGGDLGVVHALQIKRANILSFSRKTALKAVVKSHHGRLYKY